MKRFVSCSTDCHRSSRKGPGPPLARLIPEPLTSPDRKEHTLPEANNGLRFGLRIPSYAWAGMAFALLGRFASREAPGCRP